jgi:hypothetical protein
MVVTLYEVFMVLTVNIIIFEFVICVLVCGYRLFAWAHCFHGKDMEDRGRMFFEIIPSQKTTM